ncbi:hypothetical protein GC098_24550, partial [Paenibacillus sp. LMG 31458]
MVSLQNVLLFKKGYRKRVRLISCLAIIMLIFNGFASSFIAAANASTNGTITSTNASNPEELLHLSFDDNVTDSSLYNTSVKVNGPAPVYVPGKFGKALQFGASSVTDATYLDLGNSDQFNNFGRYTDFTIAFWTKIPTTDNVETSIISNMDSSTGANNGWNISVAGNVIRSKYTTSGNPGLVMNMNGVVDNGWHHVIVSYKRDGMATFYRDGVAISSYDISSIMGEIDTPFTPKIGVNGKGQFLGKTNVLLDEMRMFRKAVTADEAMSLYREGQVFVSGVSVDKPVVTLNKGETTQLNAIIAPSNPDNSNVTWKSSNPFVASVSVGPNGTAVVSAVSGGTTNITVTTADGGFMAVANVTVTGPSNPVTQVKLDSSTLEIRQSQKANLHAILSPAMATNQNLIWSSSDPAIVGVTGVPEGTDAIVEGLNPGFAIITVKTEDGNFTDTCIVSVDDSAGNKSAILKMSFENNMFDIARNVHAAVYGTPAFVPGEVGNALLFDAPGQYLDLIHPQFGYAANFDLSFWINSSATIDNRMIISNKDGSDPTSTGWSVGLENGGLHWNYKTLGSAPLDYVIANVADGNWHYIAISHDRSYDKYADFYKDGVLIASVDLSNNVGTIDSGFSTKLGADGTGHLFGNAKVAIDELQISSISVANAPTNVQATMVNISANQVSVTWNASTSGQIATYKIYRSLSSDFVPDYTNYLGQVIGTKLTYTDTLNNKGTYYYKVMAVDSGNVSATSDSSPSLTGGGYVPDLPEPLAWWKFDETAGTTVADSSANGITGTAYNNPTWTAGKFGGAISLNMGSTLNQRVEFPSAKLNPTDGQTVMFWFKTTEPNGAFTNENVYRHDGHFTALQLSAASGAPRAAYWPSSAGSYVAAPFSNWSTYKDNNWHHYAAAYDKNTGLKIYVDGVQVASNSTNVGTLKTSTAVVVMGAVQGGGGESFKGSLDDVRVYGSALTQRQVQQVMNPVESISVNGAGGANAITVKNGTLQMQAAVLPANAKSSVTWNVYEADGVTATDKASIDANGLLSAKKDGTVKVVAAATDGSGVQGSTTIAISGQALVKSITVSGEGGANAITAKNGTLQMQADVQPAGSNYRIAWSVFEADGVTATDKASIDANGLLLAKKDGTVKVVAGAIDNSGLQGAQGSTTITISGQNVPILVGITAPADITGLANGTAKTTDALGLPATVALVTDTGSVNANVAWNVESSSYDPAQKTSQTFSVNGTVTLPAGVVNPNNVALTTSISVTVLAAPSLPQSTLTGVQQVTPGQTFNLTMGLTGVTQSVYQQVYGQDLTLHYDPMSLQFNSVTSLKDGFKVIDQEEKVPGQVRIVAAGVGSNVYAQGDLLSFQFTAKSVTQATYMTTISVDHVVIANAQGNELQVGGASYAIQISIPVDKSLLNALIASAQAKYNAAAEGNGDGLYAIGAKAQLQSAIDTANAIAIDPNAN